MQRTALFIAAIVFALVTTAHVWRIFQEIEIIVNGNPVPMEASYIGAGVTGLLTLWMLIAAVSSRR